MRRWIVALAMAGCAPTPVPEAPPVLAIEKVAPPMVEEVATEPEPAMKRCEVATNDLDATGQSWDLRLPGSDEAWGYLAPREKGDAAVYLEGERGETMPYRFHGDGVALKGAASTDSVELYAKRPLWFASVVLVRADHPLEWDAAKGSGVAVGLDLGRRFKPERLKRDMPCGQLGLLAEQYDEDTLMDVDGADDVQVVGNEDLAFFAKAGAAQPVLTAFGQDGIVVQVKERGDKRHRVVMSLGPAVIDAWVAKDRLSSLVGLLGRGGGGTGFGIGTGRLGPSQRRDLRCARELPISIDQGDQRAPVGSLDPNRMFWVDDGIAVEKGWRIIHIEDAPFGLRGPSKVMAEERLVKRCETL